MGGEAKNWYFLGKNSVTKSSGANSVKLHKFLSEASPTSSFKRVQESRRRMNFSTRLHSVCNDKCRVDVAFGQFWVMPRESPSLVVPYPDSMVAPLSHRCQDSAIERIHSTLKCRRCCNGRACSYEGQLGRRCLDWGAYIYCGQRETF